MLSLRQWTKPLLPLPELPVWHDTAAAPLGFIGPPANWNNLAERRLSWPNA
jgi:hypothetical protein